MSNRFLYLLAVGATAAVGTGQPSKTGTYRLCTWRQDETELNQLTFSFFATIKYRQIKIRIPGEAHRLLLRISLAISSLAFELQTLSIKTVIGEIARETSCSIHQATIQPKANCNSQPNSQ